MRELGFEPKATGFHRFHIPGTRQELRRAAKRVLETDRL